MNLKERLKADYFGGNRYAVYRNILKKAIENGYNFVSVKDYCKQNTMQVILRHDIDSDISIAKRMFKIEKELNIKSTYYFRKSTAHKKFIQDLKIYGNEVSYHFEEIAEYAYKHRINHNSEILAKMSEIQENFKKNIDDFRDKYDCECVTVASHGDFVNRKTGLINNILLTPSARKETGILKEAYDKDLIETSKYCSDCKPDFSESCDFNGMLNYYLLVHPRNWASNFFSRLFLDLQRIVKGVNYKFGCKINNLSKTIKSIFALPKEQLTFIGEENYQTYRYFVKPHPKYLIFQNKGIGACLLIRPESMKKYLAGKERQNLRTSRNKCIKNGYIFKEINVKDHVDGIWEINTSKQERQGSEMNKDYFDKDLIIKHSEGKICFGVFNNEGKILSYCYLINAGDFIIISRLLGHADDLKEGVMFFMISECVRQWLENSEWERINYFFYDTYYGAKDGMKKFKTDLGFKPYRVRYKIKLK